MSVVQYRVLWERGIKRLRKVIHDDATFSFSYETVDEEDEPTSAEFAQTVDEVTQVAFVVGLMQTADKLLQEEANAVVKRREDAGIEPEAPQSGGRLIWLGDQHRLYRVDRQHYGYYLRWDIHAISRKTTAERYIFSEVVMSPEKIALLEQAVRIMQYANGIIESKIDQALGLKSENMPYTKKVNAGT